MNAQKVILVFLLIVSTWTNGNSQQMVSKIRGVVEDFASESPLPYATIHLLNTEPSIGTTSNELGEFYLENIPVGRYAIQISYLGYETIVLTNILVSTARAQLVRVQLKESVIAMEEIVVRPKEEKEKPLNKMATVSARQLRVEEANKFAGGFDDPARLAASFAGVASNLTTNGIIIRGNAPKGLLWRIEGVEVPNPNHFGEISGFGAGGITALSSQMLSNSDFFTGAFPAEYGNALSGVFDLKLRNGNNKDYEHALQLGFLGLDASSEGPFKKGKRGSYLFNYRYSTLGLVDAFLPQEDALGINYQDVSFKLNFPTMKAGVFSLWGLGLVDKAKSVAESDSTLWNYYEDIEGENSNIKMGVAGFQHKYFLNNDTYLKTSISASINQLSSVSDLLDQQNNWLPVIENTIKYDTRNLNFSTLLNHKFNAHHTNRTGLTINQLHYNIQLDEAERFGEALAKIVDDNGNSYLFQAYTQSTFSIGADVEVNPGFHVQHFLLNKKTVLEPRLSIKWNLSEIHSFALGYGKHSRLEKLNFYLARTNTSGRIDQANKDLDFSKAHHLVFAYNRMFGSKTHLKIEPYYQLLFDVPVGTDNSFSFLNLEEDFFVNEALVNTGRGKNIGIDITLERFLDKGWYYLLTGSFFDSKYLGGDQVWRNTRYNKGVVTNVLIGKEWAVGNQNLLNISGKFTYQKGDWMNPVDVNASLAAKDIIEDYSKVFEEQKPDSPLLHLTVTYRKNKKNHASLWSLQVLNVLGTKEQYGYRYNFRTDSIDRDEEAVVIPNLSYKIEF